MPDGSSSFVNDNRHPSEAGRYGMGDRKDRAAPAHGFSLAGAQATRISPFIKGI